jgi:hypothetical protein
VISPTTSVAIVNVNADGSTTLYCGTVDMGQGSDTAMAQMVGEILNIPAEAVNVMPRDTDVTPYDTGTLGSRSLFHMGHARSASPPRKRATRSLRWRATVSSKARADWARSRRRSTKLDTVSREARCQIPVPTIGNGTTADLRSISSASRTGTLGAVG